MEDYRQVQLSELEQKIEETKALLNDPEVAEMAKEEILNLEKQKQDILATYQTDNKSDDSESDLDQRNVIIQVSGAAGGDEANIWGQELLRMYTRFAENNKLKVEQLDEGVIKVDGKSAFEMFKYEAGVHRVQRIPLT